MRLSPAHGAEASDTVSDPPFDHDEEFEVDVWELPEDYDHEWSQKEEIEQEKYDRAYAAHLKELENGSPKAPETPVPPYETVRTLINASAKR